MSSKTCFVTGATGFVGAAVARQLAADGWSLRLLSRAGNDRRNVAGLQGATIVEGDLAEPDGFASALEGCQALFHVAADYRIWVPDEAAMNRVNVQGTEKLMRAAIRAKIPRVVYTSSVAVLGIPKGGVGSEDTPVTLDNMIGVYKRSKYLAEERVRAMVAKEGLPAVIVNPSTPIGPRDIKPTPTGRIIVEAAAGRMPAYVDTGLNIAHVDDVAAGHLLAYEKGRVGERYILGGENLDFSAILAIVADLTGRRAPTIKLPRGPLFPLAYMAEAFAHLTGKEPFITVDGLKMASKKMFFDSSKAQRELGYAPRPARDALADAVAWFQQNGYL